MEKITSRLTWTFAGKMLIVGMVVGFILISTYAIPMPQDAKVAAGTNYLTFQSVCTTCHEEDQVINYRGSVTWPGIVDLMIEFGGFFTDNEIEEVIEYLETTYPR